MKLSQVLAAATFGVSAVVASPLVYFKEPQTNANPFDKRQAGNYFVISGFPNVVTRQEIRSFAGDTDAYNLFLLAFAEMQGASQTDKTSFFQIANIHGNPQHTNWDGVGPTAGNSGNGYCTHNMNLFGPWHRPYLSCMEMIIYQRAQNIANSASNAATRSSMQAALGRIRLPYWDWASNGGTIPTQMSSSTVTVTRGDGARVAIRNPLNVYGFHPRPSWHNGNDVVRGNSNANLAASYSSTRRSTFNILSQFQSFNLFSNHGSGRSSIGNLESIHDSIHVNVGGDMGFIGLSSFDPLFFLHHCNVDRIMALWKVLYPGNYVGATTSPSSTYTISAGQRTDANTALTPFHNSASGSFHTANTVQFASSMGYNYPEYADNPSAATLRQRINNLYGSGSNFVKRAGGSSNSHHVYQLSVGAPLGLGSIALNVFLGKPTSAANDAAAWNFDKNFIGTIGLLSKANMFKLQKPEGTLDLTEFLAPRVASGEIEDNSEETITKYLAENLYYRLELAGVVTDIKTLASPLIFSLYSIEVIPPADSTQFPKWLEPKLVSGLLDNPLIGF